MKKNRIGRYREDAHTDSFEDAIDLESGEPVRSKEQNSPTWELLRWAELRTGNKYVNPKKEAKLISNIVNAGYNKEQIIACWERLEKDEYWAPKGINWIIVGSEISKKPEERPHFKKY